MSSAPSVAGEIASRCRILWGWLFITVGLISFLGFLYAAIVSQLLSPSDNLRVSSIQNNKYYCYLVPLTFPVLVVSVYFHWLGTKLFKHA